MTRQLPDGCKSCGRSRVCCDAFRHLDNVACCETCDHRIDDDYRQCFGCSKGGGNYKDVIGIWWHWDCFVNWDSER